MVKRTLSIILLLVSQATSIHVNNMAGRDTDRFEPEHTQEFLKTRNFNLRHQDPINLSDKKYKQFDMADDAIPWDGKDRYEEAALLREHVQIHQNPNKSSINWAGVPDSLIEKMKQYDAMPGRGIPNRVMMLAPNKMEPSWFRSYNQKMLPNGTEFIVYDYDSMDAEVKSISEEMEKFGIKGAYRAFQLTRPFAYKKDILQWMALWKHGGIMMDAKMGWQKPVSDWVDFKNDEMVSCADPSMITDDQFLMMTKHHPIGLMMTQQMIDNINNRDYYDGSNGQRYSDLNITGPDAFRNMLIQRHQETFANLRCMKVHDPKRNQYDGFLLDGPNGTANTQIFKNDPVKGEEVFFLMKNCTQCNDYKVLMRNRQVYCDQPGPTLGCDGKNWTSFVDENSWKHMKTGHEEWASLKQDKEYNQTAVAQEDLLTHDIYLAHKPHEN